jgi:hypothetical protein
VCAAGLCPAQEISAPEGSGGDPTFTAEAAALPAPVIGAVIGRDAAPPIAHWDGCGKHYALRFFGSAASNLTEAGLGGMLRALHRHPGSNIWLDVRKLAVRRPRE